MRKCGFAPALLVAGVMLLLALAGCGGDKNYVKIKGSETVLPISLKLAEVALEDQALPKVSVTAGGSGVGVAALLQDNTDIAMASRAMKFEEKISFRNKGFDFVEITVGLDALALIVHPDNPVQGLTLKQIKDIFQGKIANWKEVGGKDMPIVAFNRESSSGTYGFFQKKVLKKERFGKLETVGANGELVEKVAGSENTIGYVGVAFLNEQVKALPVMNEELGKPVEPNIENSMNGAYPLTRPLFYYYLKQREARVKPVIDYITSQEGQELVLSVDYPPNPEYYKAKP